MTDPASRDRVFSLVTRPKYEALQAPRAGTKVLPFVPAIRVAAEMVGASAATYPRPQAMKAADDPNNFFRCNQNMVPKA